MMCLSYMIGIHVLISVCVQSLSTVGNKYDIRDIDERRELESTSVANIKVLTQTVMSLNDESMNASSSGNSFALLNVSKVREHTKATESLLAAQNNSEFGDVHTDNGNMYNDSNVLTNSYNISHDDSGATATASLELNLTSFSTEDDINTTGADQRNTVETTKYLQHEVTTVSPAPNVKAKTTFHMNANLPFHVPYMIHGQSGKLKTLFLEGSKRATLKHHLQLVPMEDEPLGPMMVNDQRYVISVLVPIAIGVLGAALIAGTVFSLRYIARRRALDTPIDDDFDIERDQSPCIPSISGDTTDKVFLLMGDEE